MEACNNEDPYGGDDQLFNKPDQLHPSLFFLQITPIALESRTLTWIFKICNAVLGIISDSSIPPTIPSRSKNKIEGLKKKKKIIDFSLKLYPLKKPNNPI